MPTLPGLDFLSATELVDIKADFAKAMDDTQIGAATITYRRRSISAGSATYDPTTGAITDAHTSKANVSCLVGAPSDEDSRMGGVEIEKTDRKFLVDRADLDADPIAGDLVVYSSTTYEVYWTKHHEATGACLILCKVYGGEA